MIRLVFWGSPGIAAEFLEHLAQNHGDEFSVVAVVTQTPKVVQRQGKTEARSAVHSAAEKLGIPVFTPKSVKKEADALLAEFLKIGFDLFVVLAYGKILPQSIIDAPRLKSVNFHGSLLPLLRGAAPIEHAILNGFSETGWTLQRIVAELDAGDIVAQSKVQIDATDTTGTLYAKLTADLLKQGPRILTDYITGRAEIHAQDSSRATHCGKISAEDGKIDWSRPAQDIYNQYRAFTPRPGVFSFFRGKKVKLALTPPPGPLPLTGEGGQLTKIGNSLYVTCRGCVGLEIKNITPEGKKSMPAADFINGYRVTDTDRLE